MRKSDLMQMFDNGVWVVVKVVKNTIEGFRIPEQVQNMDEHIEYLKKINTINI